MTPRVHIAPRMLLIISLLAVGVFLCAATSASAGARKATPTGVKSERTGNLLVQVDRGASSRATTNVLRGLGARTAGAQVPQVGLVTMRPLAGQTLAATAAILRKLPWVKSVTPERRHEMRFVPNDPTLTTPESGSVFPGTVKEWWAARLNLFSGWDVTRGSGAKVAVIDSGIDGNHPEFAGKIVAGFDNDIRPTGPANFDANGHGTHVSSLACAAGNNAVGVVGSGLNCGLIVMKTDFSDSSITRSLVQATDAGANAINMSFGTDGTTLPPPVLVEAMKYAFAKGVVLVAAAANQPIEEQGDPANVLQPTGTGPDINFNNGLSVTSADVTATRTGFAGRGTQISLAAHGNYHPTLGPNGILGAWPANLTEIDVEPCNCRTALNGDNRYAYLAGTSMATPQVAGVAAVVAHLNPDLPASEVVKILKLTASRAPGSGWNPELGWGIVNLGAAVAAARVIDRAAPASKVKGPKKTRRTRLTLKWSGKDRKRPGLTPSGIKRYEIFRSVNGGRYKRIAKTARNKKRIKLTRGKRYRFYSVAIDKAGNREMKPRKADVSLRVLR